VKSLQTEQGFSDGCHLLGSGYVRVRSIMGKRVYVGNLSYSTTEDGLRTLFTEFGAIEEVKLITDRYSGRSKGFAFVEMGTDEEAQAAITALNGKVVDDRELKVAEARPRREREPRRDDPFRSRW
jgi:RNA recognition motif-containing protein